MAAASSSSCAMPNCRATLIVPLTKSLWPCSSLLPWGGAIVASTLLVHQHYMLDVATGFMLGWGAVRLVYQPMTSGESSETEQTLRPTDSQQHLPSTREPPA